MILAVMGWTMARALAVAGAAVASGWLVHRATADPDRNRRRWVWMLMLIPLLTPGLFVGYAYSNFSLSLIHHSSWSTVLYAALVWLKYTPVAALALHVAPREVSDAGLHCRRLAGRAMRASGNALVMFWLRGPGRPILLAFTLVFLLAFGEFEIASLMLVSSWTVMLFDAQVGGMELMSSLKMAVAPMLVEVAVFGGAVIWIVRARGGQERLVRSGVGSGRGATGWAWLILGGAVGLVTVLPAWIVMRGAWTGLGGVWVIQREVMVSVGFASVSAMLAMWAARGMLRRWGKWGCVAASVPGLMGPLLTGLMLVAVFQLPVARMVYDSPVPLLAGFVVLLMPVAVLLMLLMRVDRKTSGVHVAQLMGRSSVPVVREHSVRLRWVLSTRRVMWTGLLLFFWAYFDVTMSHLLAPVGMTPVTVRLYNQMHYGQMTVLSAMVSVAVLAPVGLGLLALAVGRVAVTRRR
jgi:ABC-type Fe3+ transport system permease subunit